MRGRPTSPSRHTHPTQGSFHSNRALFIHVGLFHCQGRARFNHPGTRASSAPPPHPIHTLTRGPHTRPGSSPAQRKLAPLTGVPSALVLPPPAGLSCARKQRPGLTSDMLARSSFSSEQKRILASVTWCTANVSNGPVTGDARRGGKRGAMHSCIRHQASSMARGRPESLRE